MIKSEIILGALKALLDRPAQAGHCRQFGQGGTGWGKDQVIGFFSRCRSLAADEKPMLKAAFLTSKDGGCVPSRRAEALWRLHLPHDRPSPRARTRWPVPRARFPQTDDPLHGA